MRSARSFTKDINNYLGVGVGAIGTVINGASSISVHAWVLFNSLTSGSTANRIIGTTINGSGAPGFAIGIDGATQFCRVSARSTTADATQAAGASGRAKASYGTWTSIGVVIDYLNDLISIYVKGKFDSQSIVTFAATAYTHGTATTGDVIGANVTPVSTPDAQLDGRISEVAIWRVALGPRDFLRLSKGIPATKLQSRPSIYMKLDGLVASEICSVGSGIVGTPTGVIPLISGPSSNLSFLSYGDTA